MEISRLARDIRMVRDRFSRPRHIAYALLVLEDGLEIVRSLPDYHEGVSLDEYAHESVLALEERGLLDDFLDVLRELRDQKKTLVLEPARARTLATREAPQKNPDV